MLTTLGKYLIKREIGTGAMGVVYEGFDPFEMRTVAIKTVLKSSLNKARAPEVLGRLRREAQAAGRLTHPNIVSVYDYGEDGDMAFIVMEHVVGIMLKDYFEMGKKFQLSEIDNFATQLLEALDFAHSRGVLHRDIQPANNVFGKGGQLKVSDFGAAKIEASDVAQPAAASATPACTPPEQLAGGAPDQRSNVYSAGVIVYQFLTGQSPFGSGSAITSDAVLNSVPVAPSKLNGSLPEALNDVALKALAKKPEERFQSARDFLNAFKSALGAKAAHPAAPAPQAKGPAADTTAINAGAAQPTPSKSGVGDSSLVNFNVSEFDKRFADSHSKAKDAASGKLAPAKPTDAAAPDDDLLGAPLSSIVLTFQTDEPANVAAKEVAPEKIEPVKAPIEAAPFQSGLLASLANEAKSKLDAKQSAVQENRAKNQGVHDALDRLAKFFNPFVKHVNDAEPTINRAYQLDARSRFSDLKWKGGVVDLRKQGLSDTALLDYVALAVRLCAPAPVELKRPWGQMEALKKELQYLKLRTVEDLEVIAKMPPQGWIPASLSPEIPLQVKFRGNYDKGYIDVACHNVETFGPASFRLEPQDVTQAFLDGFGLFLLGRAPKLPLSLKPAV